MQLLPGKAVFDPPKPKMAKPVAPTTVERDDPEVTATREDLRLSGLQRRGRASTILTGGDGVTGEARLGRPVGGRKPIRPELDSETLG